ncbi:MAG: HAMP domain-containing sensor histidine kinase [Paracoccus sp. (in: a-proteobacteria)]|nr:HAMP domain-containing sensor histidine kinase [Paracoccus sp. (in: a-proteobacteria)]
MSLPGLGSIRGRLIWLAALWLGLALLAAWLVIGALLERFVTQRFDAELDAAASALMAGIEADADGLAQLVAAPADPRFERPLSGWFWQIAADGEVFAQSGSLYLSQLGEGGRAPDGAKLRVLNRDFTAPGSDEALRATVTAPQAEIDAALRDVRAPLAVSLAVLGAGLVAAILIQVTAGLGALRQMGADVRAIREGASARLPAQNARELRDLAAEMNALLDARAAQLERSREQIGNLAHSLKTPLMAIGNDLPPGDPGHALIAQMDRQIGWHLKRARSAATTAREMGQHSALGPVIDDILVVLRRMIEDRGLAVDARLPPDLRIAAEQQDAQEMIGNLLENAAKWARSRIELRAEDLGHTARIEIADDGPGMDEADHARAVARGARLDERGPQGAGLGLAIVADLAGLLGGSLSLGRDERLGGLKAVLLLPK